MDSSKFQLRFNTEIVSDVFLDFLPSTGYCPGIRLIFIPINNFILFYLENTLTSSGSREFFEEFEFNKNVYRSFLRDYYGIYFRNVSRIFKGISPTIPESKQFPGDIHENIPG